MGADLEIEALETWMKAGWLMPRRDATGWRFSDRDLARARLISDLQQDLGINNEGVTVVLDLLDQLHGLRRTLRGLLSAVCVQPEAIRRRIAAEMCDLSEPLPQHEEAPANRHPGEPDEDVQR